MMMKPSAQDTIPSRFRCVFGDQAVFGMSRFFDRQLHCVISFDGRVDESRIARAVRLTLDAEPVLGCRFIERWWRPYWQRRDDLDRVELVSLVETSQPEDEILNFMVTPTDLSVHPLARCRVIRSRTDTLCIKMDHLAVDAGGAKEYAYLLASIYRRLADNPAFVPEPNVRGRRSMRQLGEQFGFMDKLKIIRRNSRDAASLYFPRAYWAFPSYSAVVAEPTYVLRHIGRDQFLAMKRLGKKYNATINDMMLAAIFRALYEIIRPKPGAVLRLTNTVDLRRYMPSGRTEALCSFSGFSYPNIGQELGTTFEDTLIKVRDDMNARKADYAGLGDFVPGMAIFKFLPFDWGLSLFRQVWGRMVTTGILPPDFTNLGAIDSGKLDFGTLKTAAVWLTAGGTFPPFFGMGLSGFSDSLTLSVGFCQTAAQREVVERFLDRIIHELPAP
jgi:NRPS condensation-like uncharacterized protein